MPEHSKAKIAFTFGLLLIALYSPVSLATAQTTVTSTVTQTTSVYSTSSQKTTVTSSTTSYTTTTETLNSTIRGTQTQFYPSLTTVTSTLTSAVGGTMLTTSTVTLTTVLTQATQILANTWGVTLALIVFVSAIASYLLPKTRSQRPKEIVCRNCGTPNPPFAKAFCVKCGNSLQES